MFVKFSHEICSNRTLCSEFHINVKKTNLLTHVFILFVFVHTLRCLLFVVVFYEPYLISFGKIHFAVSKRQVYVLEILK